MDKSMAQSSYRTQLNNYLKESGIGLDIISPLIQNLALGPPLLRSEYIFFSLDPLTFARTPPLLGVVAKSEGVQTKKTIARFARKFCTSSPPSSNPWRRHCSTLHINSL